MAIDGRCFTYVFPCAWEDHCKIGFSRDPLGRLQTLHSRWFEQFDLDGISLVEAESVRDARDLELRLRRPFALHNAPPPSTVRFIAGGHTEWFRGVGEALRVAVDALRSDGYTTHLGRGWLVEALTDRRDRLFEWSLAQLAGVDLAGACTPVAFAHVIDALDAYTALEINLEDHLPPSVWRWYCRMQAR